MNQQKTKFKQTEIGMIPEGWEIKKLRDICIDISYGYTASAKLQEIGPKFLRITDIQDEFINWRDVPYCEINEEDHKKYKLEQGDIVIARTGASTGTTKIIQNNIDAIFASYLIRYKINKKIANPFFVGFVLKSNLWKSHVGSIIGGSAQPGANAKQFGDFEFDLPTLEEQDVIVMILSSLNSKIELNQQMNKTLEAIGQAIFRHWFIDFEFPNEKGKPYKSSGGEMVDSELGEIPKGWKVFTLREFITVERGLSYKGSGLTEHGLPMINLANFAPNHGFIDSATKPYSGEYKARNLVKAGDIVIANTDITQKRDVLGSPAIVPNLASEKILFTHHVYAVRNKSWIPNYFIYYLLQLKQYEDRTRGFATGTTVLFLPDDAILDFHFVLSNRGLVEKFVSIMKIFQDRLNLDTSEHITLTILRDSLLPRLMSGKIRVPVEVRT